MKTKTILPPDPRIVATRRALAKRPQQPLEQVMQQAKASEEWRRKSGSANGLKRQAA